MTERPSPPAEEDVAVLSEEVAKLLLREASELLPLQHESLHAVQVFVPLLHQLLGLDRKGEGGSEEAEADAGVASGWETYFSERHGGLTGEEERGEVGLHLVLLLGIFLHLRGDVSFG